jgi:hypothetical protein
VGFGTSYSHLEMGFLIRVIYDYLIVWLWYDEFITHYDDYVKNYDVQVRSYDFFFFFC